MRASLSIISWLAVASWADAAAVEARAVQATTAPTAASSSATAEPNWFQTTPQSYQGTTATGAAQFLAETNPVTFAHKSFTANGPLQTGEPIDGAAGRNIFQQMGDLSPYFSPAEGFGVNEYALPKGSKITQMHMIHRHGARYPSSSENMAAWAQKITNSTASGNKFTGALSFLNDWRFGLGAEILAPKGREELFQSGVLNWYNYGQLYNESSTHRLVVRTTTQDRMLKSAENFLAGFFGLEWTEKANLTSNLKKRTAALAKLSGSYNWTSTDSYTAQSLCTYETISLGYSQFCQLFTYKEFEHYGYTIDLMFAALTGFQSPVGRAMGIAWVEEFLARVEGHFLQTTGTSANMTLDTNPATFPTDQNLYLDFSHDAGLVAALTAFGFKQFAQFLPATGPPHNQQFSTSKIVPFAGRTNIEIIQAPHKVRARRPAGSQENAYVAGTPETFYVHFLQNQRTLPLHASFDECEYRDDGWCELSTFMAVQKQSLQKAKYEYSCFGNWTITEYGTVTDGVPAN
ncbi:histidine phosphatase family protein [Aspergillus thermomutatus]|uniref:3-phytase n=1 Tax=Aspergillus thermomutatus TaxID=41047 RepID=A0A397FY32_ASPTH|nr:uncharacterized protein CDV56_101557 [Aspergillus thermomutatus]RHZ43661.1 hypothetical protein CDV56_101557 [Aspergillus thermomutatus]